MKNKILFVGCLFFITLFGCGPLPKPFRPVEGKPQNVLVEYRVNNDIAVSVVHGTPDVMGKLLSQYIADQFVKNNLISYVGDRGSSQYILYGRVQGWRGGTASAPPLRLLWLLTDRQGNILKEYLYQVYGTEYEWNYEFSKMAKMIAKKISHAVMQEVPNDIDPAFDKIVSDKYLWIGDVANAPGDGNSSLKLSIKTVLRDFGVKIVNDVKKANVFLSGIVSIKPTILNNQRVKILWLLKTPDGYEIGRARQISSVSAGTLEGKWGRMAETISAAAAGGLIKILKIDQSKNLAVEYKKKLEIPALDYKSKGMVVPRQGLAPD